jgi:hypothetical protein
MIAHALPPRSAASAPAIRAVRELEVALRREEWAVTLRTIVWDTVLKQSADSRNELQTNRRLLTPGLRRFDAAAEGVEADAPPIAFTPLPRRRATFGAATFAALSGHRVSGFRRIRGLSLSASTLDAKGGTDASEMSVRRLCDQIAAHRFLSVPERRITTAERTARRTRVHARAVVVEEPTEGYKRRLRRLVVESSLVADADRIAMQRQRDARVSDLGRRASRARAQLYRPGQQITSPGDMVARIKASPALNRGASIVRRAVQPLGHFDFASMHASSRQSAVRSATLRVVDAKSPPPAANSAVSAVAFPVTRDVRAPSIFASLSLLSTDTGSPAAPLRRASSQLHVPIQHTASQGALVPLRGATEAQVASSPSNLRVGGQASVSFQSGSLPGGLSGMFQMIASSQHKDAEPDQAEDESPRIFMSWHESTRRRKFQRDAPAQPVLGAAPLLNRRRMNRVATSDVASAADLSFVQVDTVLTQLRLLRHVCEKHLADWLLDPDAFSAVVTKTTAIITSSALVAHLGPFAILDGLVTDAMDFEAAAFMCALYHLATLTPGAAAPAEMGPYVVTISPFFNVLMNEMTTKRWDVVSYALLQRQCYQFAAVALVLLDRVAEDNAPTATYLQRIAPSVVDGLAMVSLVGHLVIEPREGDATRRMAVTALSVLAFTALHADSWAPIARQNIAPAFARRYGPAAATAGAGAPSALDRVLLSWLVTCATGASSLAVAAMTNGLPGRTSTHTSTVREAFTALLRNVTAAAACDAQPKGERGEDVAFVLRCVSAIAQAATNTTLRDFARDGLASLIVSLSNVPASPTGTGPAMPIGLPSTMQLHSFLRPRSAAPNSQPSREIVLSSPNFFNLHADDSLSIAHDGVVARTVEDATTMLGDHTLRAMHNEPNTAAAFDGCFRRCERYILEPLRVRDALVVRGVEVQVVNGPVSILDLHEVIQWPHRVTEFLAALASTVSSGSADVGCEAAGDHQSHDVLTAVESLHAWLRRLHEALVVVVVLDGRPGACPAVEVDVVESDEEDDEENEENPQHDGGGTDANADSSSGRETVLLKVTFPAFAPPDAAAAATRAGQRFEVEVPASWLQAVDTVRSARRCSELLRGVTSALQVPAEPSALVSLHVEVRCALDTKDDKPETQIDIEVPPLRSSPNHAQLSSLASFLGGVGANGLMSPLETLVRQQFALAPAPDCSALKVTVGFSDCPRLEARKHHQNTSVSIDIRGTMSEHDGTAEWPVIGAITPAPGPGIATRAPAATVPKPIVPAATTAALTSGSRGGASGRARKAIVHVHLGGAGAAAGLSMWNQYEEEHFTGGSEEGAGDVGVLYREHRESGENTDRGYSPRCLFVDCDDVSAAALVRCAERRRIRYSAKSKSVAAFVDQKQLDAKIVDRPRANKMLSRTSAHVNVAHAGDVLECANDGTTHIGAVLNATLASLRREAEAADVGMDVVMNYAIAGATGAGFAGPLLERLHDEHGLGIRDIHASVLMPSARLLAATLPGRVRAERPWAGLFEAPAGVPSPTADAQSSSMLLYNTAVGLHGLLRLRAEHATTSNRLVAVHLHDLDASLAADQLEGGTDPDWTHIERHDARHAVALSLMTRGARLPSIIAKPHEEGVCDVHPSAWSSLTRLLSDDGRFTAYCAVLGNGASGIAHGLSSFHMPVAAPWAAVMTGSMADRSTPVAPPAAYWTGERRAIRRTPSQVVGLADTVHLWDACSSLRRSARVVGDAVSSMCSAAAVPRHQPFAHLSIGNPTDRDMWRMLASELVEMAAV